MAKNPISAGRRNELLTPAKLAKPDDFDYLGLVGDGYAQLRRYAPEFLAAFEFRAAPASEELLRAVELLRELNANNTRKVPEGAPRGFIRRRWEPLVFAGCVEIDCPTYLKTRSEQLHDALVTVNRLAERGELPDASIVDGVLKVAPLTNLVPLEAEALMRQTYAPTCWSRWTAGPGLRALYPLAHRRGVARPHTPAHGHLGRRDQPRSHADG